VDGFRERVENGSLEYRSEQTAEVGADTAERESEVHALTQHRVQTPADSELEVSLERVQKLRHLAANCYRDN